MKIHPSSLRIGNYVDLYVNNTLVKEKHRIVAEDFKHIEALCLVGFKPIPLTEEWLLKFGFKHRKKNNIYFNDIMAFYYYKNGNVRLSMTYERFDKKVLKNIKYAHQLQNLYFALTDKELKL